MNKMVGEEAKGYVEFMSRQKEDTKLGLLQYEMEVYKQNSGMNG
jgi:hypothetical protein